MTAGYVQADRIATDAPDGFNDQVLIFGQIDDSLQDGIVFNLSKTVGGGQQLLQALASGLWLQAFWQGFNQPVQGVRVGHAGKRRGLHTGVGIVRDQFEQYVRVVQMFNGLLAYLWIPVLPPGAGYRVKQ
jgi:hypothetical protein